MLAKYWKKIGMLILIIACVFNIMSKLVNKLSLNKEMIYSAEFMYNQEEKNQTTITCACGNVLEVGSTKKDLKVDVCSKCHPYWTGNLRQETAGGRADKFKKKYGLA